MKRARRLSRLMILAAAATVAASAITPALAAAAPVTGNDVSWPQCGGPLPALPGFGIVGVNDGHPYSDNPCLAAEYRWAAAAGRPGFYLNTANPGSPMGAYDYGYRGAAEAFRYASSIVPAGPGHTWWLDVETSNSWSATDLSSNMASITGAVDSLRSHGVVVGVYSTRYQWGRITGGAVRPDLPNWVPGAGSPAEAAARCSSRYSFSGGQVVVTQFLTDDAVYDGDYPCPGSAGVLRPPLPPPSPAGLGGLVNGLLSLLGLAPPPANGG